MLPASVTASPGVGGLACSRACRSPGRGGAVEASAEGGVLGAQAGQLGPERVHGDVELLGREPGGDVLRAVPVVGVHVEEHLLATAPPGRIRHCAGTGCVLWFLDTSRNGGRRWCSVAAWGQPAKPHAHSPRGRSAPRSAT